VLVGVAFLLLLAAPLLGVPYAVWLGFLGLPPAVAAARTLVRHPDVTARLVPAQAWTLRAFLLYALGVSAGLLFF
jgi:hypothetical protein